MSKEAKWAAQENLDGNFLYKITDIWKNSIEVKQFLPSTLGFPGSWAGKNPPAMRETWVQSLSWKDPLEE